MNGTPETPLPESEGTLLQSRYRLSRLIGKGSAGSVWQARDQKELRTVAVKVLHRELAVHPEIRQRFVAEARASERIAHPNVVRVFGEGQADDDTPFMVMELCDGETLDAVVQLRGAVGAEYACEMMAQVLDALEAAHALEIVHRDLKPANIMVVHPRPNQPIIKVLDFGIAKGVHPGAGDPDESGTILGTPAYMAPEQAAGDDVDARADVYSAGAILYELLTGRAPFTGKMPSLVLADVLTRPPKPLRYYDRSIPDALERVVMRTLGKDVDDRPQSALELRRQLRPWTPKAVPRARSEPDTRSERQTEPPLLLVAQPKPGLSAKPAARLELATDSVPPPELVETRATDPRHTDVDDALASIREGSELPADLLEGDRMTDLDPMGIHVDELEPVDSGWDDVTDETRPTDVLPPPEPSPSSRRLMLIADSEPPPKKTD